MRSLWWTPSLDEEARNSEIIPKELEETSDLTFIWMLVLHFDQKGALLYLIYCLGWGGERKRKQCFFQWTQFIHPCNLCFLLNFISIVVSFLNFLGSFESYLEGSQRMVPACQKPDSATCFTSSGFLSSEAGIYHLCYRWNRFGSSHFQM